MRAVAVNPKAARHVRDGATVLPMAWPTTHVGPLLVVSTTAHGPNARGEAAAIVTLVCCRPMSPADAAAAGDKGATHPVAWVLADPRPAAPVAVPAELGIYDAEGVDAIEQRDEPAPAAEDRGPRFAAGMLFA